MGFAAPAMAGETVFGLTATDKLVSFDSERPGKVSAPTAITGLAGGDDVAGIDFRPATGQMFALIKNGANGQVARIDVVTGIATPIGVPFALGGAKYGFDFNPTVDRIRVHSDAADNLRLNPNNGTIAATDPDLVFDNAIGTPSVTATAYTSSFPGTNRTALYGIDTGEDQAVEMESPAPTFQNVTRNAPLGFDATADAGFDITAKGDALAVLTTAGPGGLTKLYRIDINASANPARDIGTLGGSADPIQDIAVAPKLRMFAALVAGTPQSLVTFRSDRPAQTSSPVAISGLPGGVALVGIDSRNENGDLVGVATNNRIYTIDVASGAATVVGTAPFAPALNGTAFGVDFNPTVDRLRVTSDNEQNKRLNPDTGQSAVNPPDNNADDAPLTNAGNPNPNVVASAYTNPKADAIDTQLFGIDSGTDRLVLQNPANAGTLTDVGTGLGVNATNQIGYDITPEFNQGFAAIDPEGTPTASNLYSVNSVQAPAAAVGTAVLIGQIGSGLPVQGLAFLNEDAFTLTAASATVGEAAGSARLTIQRSGASEVSANVTVNTSNGSATAGSDYTAVAGQVVTFAKGETVKTVSVPITNDGAAEGNETFTVSLSNSTDGAGIGTPRSTAVTIADDDARPAVVVYQLPAGTPGPGSGPDRVAPIVTLGLAETARLRSLRRGVRLTVGCSEACSFTATAKLGSRVARRQGVRRLVATLRGQRSSAGVIRRRVKLSRNVRRKLSDVRAFTIIVTVTARDTAGNARRATERIRITRR